MRGFGLPGCASGVTVPTSTLPKPIAPKASMQRPFLSSPAARPMRFGKAQAGERHRIVDAALRRRCRPAACAGSPPARRGSGRARAPGRARTGTVGPGDRERAAWRGDSGIAVAYSTPAYSALPTGAGAAMTEPAHRERHLRRHRRAGRPPLGRADRSARCTTSTSRPRRCRAELIRALALVKRSAAVVNRDARHARSDEGRRDRRRRRRGARRRARRRVPALGLADRLRHADQHEHERGARQPRLAAARRAARRRPARASERRRQPQPVVERRLPDGDERRRGRGARRAACCRRSRRCATRSPRRPRRSPTSSRSAARTCRTRRRSRSARRSPAGSRSSTTAWRTSSAALPHLCELALGGTAVGTGLNAQPEFGARVAAELARAHRPAVRLRAEQVRGARRARRARLRPRRAEDAGGVADEDRQRRALARLGAALRARRDPHSRERAGQLDHAGQGQPDPVRGADDALRPGVRQRRRDQRRRRVRQLRAQRLQAGADPQLPAERAPARRRLQQLRRALRARHRARPRRASTSWCSAR